MSLRKHIYLFFLWDARASRTSSRASPRLGVFSFSSVIPGRFDRRWRQFLILFLQFWSFRRISSWRRDVSKFLVCIIRFWLLYNFWLNKMLHWLLFLNRFIKRSVLRSSKSHWHLFFNCSRASCKFCIPWIRPFFLFNFSLDFMERLITYRIIYFLWRLRCFYDRFIRWLFDIWQFLSSHLLLGNFRFNLKVICRFRGID